jgi:hypothetical protein
VPQSTASASYIAVMRAGSRLLYAARQAAVASAALSFPPVPPPPVLVAQADNNATNSTPYSRTRMIILLSICPSNAKAELRDSESANLKPLVSRLWLRGTS